MKSSWIDALALPVIAAPMFLVSGPEMVIAAGKAGVVGTFPALNARTTEGLVEWLTAIKAGLHGPGGDKPFGVNLIVHKTNPRLAADLAAVVAAKVPLVITSLGAVRDVVDAVHSYGGLVFHDVISRRHAEKAAEAGVDGLVLVTAGAGGHAGTLNPFAFLAEVRSFFPGLIALAGGMSDGAAVAAARAAGADFAYMGTRFIATVESMAPAGYKEMILKSGTADIVYTAAVSGVNANFLKDSLAQNKIDAAAPAPAMDMGHENEAKAWRDVWSAGHGVAEITDCPTIAELVARLAREYGAAKGRL